VMAKRAAKRRETPEEKRARRAATSRAQYHRSIAGEFYVAAELQRREIHAAVTYGNAKATDIIAFSRDRDRSVVVEVKSTDTKEWVVGSGEMPPASPKPWVFVRIPKGPHQAKGGPWTRASIEANLEYQRAVPTYYVALQSELRDYLVAVWPNAKPGARGVWNFKCAPEDPLYWNRWDKITDQLGPA
jgi:hypothetical protein